MKVVGLVANAGDYVPWEPLTEEEIAMMRRDYDLFRADRLIAYWPLAQNASMVTEQGYTTANVKLYDASEHAT